MARDPDHWLWRLEAAAWVTAASHELELGRRHIETRRRAVTHARRGAGMALNAVLVAMADRGWSDDDCVTMWGRSYIDHLRAVAALETAPAERHPLGPRATELAREVLSVAVVPAGNLVQLSAKTGGEAAAAIQHAQALVDLCAAFVTPQ